MNSLIRLFSPGTLRPELQHSLSSQKPFGSPTSQVELESQEHKLAALRDRYNQLINEQAMEEAVPAFQAERRHVREARERFNPSDYPESIPVPPSIPSNPEHYLIAGDAQNVAERIAELRDIGARNVLLNMTTTELPREKVSNSMRLFAEKVAPLFRKD